MLDAAAGPLPAAIGIAISPVPNIAVVPTLPSVATVTAPAFAIGRPQGIAVMAPPGSLPAATFG
ncbi:hypothetical protein AB0I28_26350 [Phytomonospora sp. NPDC050363]|uniref:hypothetical protein n=1 Tax=Phytomonospora sp. NPDC050363 TaxID=3155642 RepID=UPI003401F4EC